ncbi:HIT family hydrolase [[Pantoea] beijingensis]|uniref:HIT family hydrolase n=1 Tax=[Pantoea] beijingensis TaxID=1324864 RepID=A0A443I980_9GAMM|nr:MULTISPECIES: HIT family protein [Erwiniaceae]RWR00652.1 HIT family hydrolase [[Pantoea] beijingensis]
MSEHPCSYCFPQNESVIWKNEKCRVLLVNDSAFTGWCRVVWQKHQSELSELTADERNHIIQVVAEVERMIINAMQPAKMNLASLGTGLPHLHWHIIPRYRDDSHFPEAIWGTALREGEVRALPDTFTADMSQHLDRVFG